MTPNIQEYLSLVTPENCLTKIKSPLLFKFFISLPSSYQFSSFYSLHFKITSPIFMSANVLSTLRIFFGVASNGCNTIVFETIFCENLFDLTKMCCCYETRNVYGMYRKKAGSKKDSGGGYIG